jgi:hypothetical protein
MRRITGNSQDGATSAADLKSLTHSRRNRVQGLQIESGIRPIGGGHKPFVLVNYSPTICLNPPLRLFLEARFGWPRGRSNEEM